MKKKVKIAIGQILCIDGDRAGNLKRIEYALIEAKTNNADIIVFPESCLLGWINPESHKRSSQIPGNDSELISLFARKYSIYICIGLDEKENDKLFGSAILVDNQGVVLLKHRKINVLPELMTPPYSSGDEIEVVKTKFGIIGVLICADSFLTNIIERMKEKKPDLLLIPYGWAATEIEWPDHGQELIKVVKNVGDQLNCPVIGTNMVGQISQGKWAGRIYGGASVAYIKSNSSLVIGKDRERDILLIVLEY